MKNDLRVLGLLVVSDGNEDEGCDEIFIDGVNTNSDCKSASAGKGKGEGEFLARSKRKSKASPSFLPGVMWRAKRRACRIPRPFVDYCLSNFFLKTISSLHLYLALFRFKNTCAKTLVLLSGVYFSYNERKLPEKQIRPCSSPAANHSWSQPPCSWLRFCVPINQSCS